MSELVLCGTILSAKQLFKKWREKFASLYKSADELSESGYVWTGKFDFDTLRVDEKI